MMKMRQFAALLLTLLLLCSAAAAEGADAVIAMVNGEALTESDYAPHVSKYQQLYASAGYDMADENLAAYIADLALTAAIEEKLVQQDMKAQGCFDFDAATEAWLNEQGSLAYQAALSDVAEALRAELGYADDVDMTQYALTYASIIGVTEADYIDVYRTQYAYVNYYAWLLRDTPVTEDDILAAYEARVADSRTRFEHDIPAFETAMYNGEEVWYMPEGYRRVQSIVLAAEGDTDAARLASVQGKVDDINARLKDGCDFMTLVKEYNMTGLPGGDTLQEGYSVHRESVYWEEAFVTAAFAEEMTQPGCWSKPVVGEAGVYIVWYLADSESGPLALNDDLHDVLGYAVYNERAQAALMARVQQLSDAAVVEIR